MSETPQPRWLQMRIMAAPGTGEAIAEALSEAGALSVTMEDAADDPVLEPLPGEAPLWPHTAVIGLFNEGVDTDDVLRRLAATLGMEPPAAEVSSIGNEDWEHSWKSDFHAMRFGSRLWVCPLGEEPDSGEAIIVRMEPGLAFGTGTHSTTALCLEWLDRHCRPGDRIVDYGSGSGILAIAAAKLGASEVWAVDIDPQARRATADNAAANGVSPVVHSGAPEDLPELTVDCVVANILAGPLIGLAPRFSAMLASGGRIALSGLLQEQVEAVAAAYANDFELEAPLLHENWALLHGRRR
ncbi:MAG: 50S ribosomal protein L11 methyltransferase [Gammaproteobacteria bacterium]|nr:50S ribosomal protein L11 methyltransferase [Gammaproteobacteria bacterium]